MKMVITNGLEAGDSLLEDNTKPFRDFLESKKPELLYFKPDKRMWLEEIMGKLLVYEDPSTHFNMIQIGASSRALPDNPDTSVIAAIIELLLIDEGYRDKIKDTDTLGLILMTFSKWIWEYLKKLEEEKAARTIQVEDEEKVSKEDLYYTIVKTIMKNRIIRTFYQKDKNKESIIDIYCFNGIVYEPCDKELEKEIEELTLESEELSKKTTSWVVKEAKSKIKRRTLEILKYEPMKIAFKNGVILDWERFKETGELRESIEEPSPDKIVFHLIPHRLALEKLEKLKGLAKYDEGMITNIEELARELCPKSLKAFKDWVGDNWVLLFEIVGYTLYPWLPLKKAFVFVGKTDSGKTTFINHVLTRILGEENIVNISLQELVDPKNKYVRANLRGKLANIHGELSKITIKTSEKFKQLTGKDRICSDRKWKDTICFFNYAKLIFATNKMPRIKDLDDAVLNRFIVIRFPNQFPENDDWPKSVFTEDEIEGIILVSLYAIRNVLIRNAFTMTETREEMNELVQKLANPVYAFIQDLIAGKMEGVKLEKDPNGKVLLNELYDLYQKYLEEIYPYLYNQEVSSDWTSKPKFGREMSNLGYPSKSQGNNRWYVGLRLIKEESLDIGSSPLFRREG